jgi:GntR family transcriptional regulator
MTASLRKRDRIREHLIALIESRAVGQAIPSERQIAAELSVSRPTLRSVVDELIADGWLIREHGRGVFVAAPKIAQRVLGGSADGGATYPPAPGTWTSRILNHSVVPAGQAIGSRLRTDAATPILRIARQRLVDATPIAVETIHLLHALVPDLDPADLESGSLYALLRSRYGVVPTEAEQRNEAAAADAVARPAYLGRIELGVPAAQRLDALLVGQQDRARPVDLVVPDPDLLADLAQGLRAEDRLSTGVRNGSRAGLRT